MVKVSYVLGILNASSTLSECLNSILMQDYPKEDYEIIIVDGGSTDKTLEIIKNYQKKERNLKLFHNPYKLSEGKGMAKDQGVSKSKGEVIIFLDHDNILTDKNWIKNILEPFNDSSVMASQSLTSPRKKDTNFLKYVNSLGVEDPFATPYSLVAQIVLNESKFKSVGNYYIFDLSEDNVLFFGANGCAFRKSVFKKIKGYTRDVDVSASMASKNMRVAVSKKSKVYHKTSNNMLSFLKKKGTYFYRFMDKEYASKKFQWSKVGSPPSTLRFFLMVLTNLTFIIPFLSVAHKMVNSRQFFWILHPFYVFFLTLIYGFITLSKIKNFVKYL